MALQISISNSIGSRDRVSGSSVDPDAQAFITAASITDPIQQAAINTLVVDLKGYNVWGKMKAIYPMVGGTATTMKWNLKDPRDLDVAFRLLFIGGGNWDVNGYTPNGSNGYANTNFIPSTHLTTSSAHFSKYNRTNDLVGSKADGVRDGMNNTFFQHNFTAANICIGEVGGVVSYTQTDSRGLFTGVRTATNVSKVFKNSTQQGSTNTTTITALPQYNLILGARGDYTPGFAATNYNSYQIAFSSIGDGLTDTEAANFYTAVQTFQTTLGRQVGTPIPLTGTLLNDYPDAAAAYSLRKLSLAYLGSAIRVRRSSDNTEQNIGFVNNVLDTAALLSFVGGGSGYITTWYDQSGNGRNVTQSTATSQPMIVVTISGLVTRGGKPAVSFKDPLANLNNSLSNAATGFPVNNVSHFAVSSKRTNGADLRTIYSTGILASADGFGLFYSTDENLYYQVRAGASIVGGGAYANVNNTNNLIFGVLQPSTDNHWFNGANNVATANTRPNANSTNPLTIGSNASPTWFHNGSISEVVFWNANQTTNRTGIETNVNSFYSIY